MSEAMTVQAILAICRQRGIVLGVAGEKLTVDAPQGAIEPYILAQFRQHKGSLLDILKTGGSGPLARQTNGDPDNATTPSMATDTDIVPWEECIEPPDPCPKCGSLMIWWDASGGQHCMICDEPKYSAEKAAELRELAKRLRQFPRPAGSSRQGR